MKVAIVSAHFRPEIGYQEVYIANACARLKHEVTVFTTSHIPASHKLIIKNNYAPGITENSPYAYKINRIKAFPISGHLVIGFGLKRAVETYSPDLIFIIGVGKIFPYPLLKEKYSPVCFFGDNQDFQSKATFKARLINYRQYLLRFLFKNLLYRKAIQCSRNIVCYTPETAQIISRSLYRKQKILLEQKKIESTLGFDPDEYFFNIYERSSVRKKLGLNENDLVIVTATRVNPNKEIEKVIDGINMLHLSGFQVHYLIIGFQSDEYEENIKGFIQKQHLPLNYHCSSFMEHETLRSYFCASDIGIWRKAAISIQESMGTGLHLFLENKKNINHLIEKEVTGWTYEKNSFHNELIELVKGFSKLDKNMKLERRLKNVQINQKFSYDSIINNIILKSNIEITDFSRTNSIKEHFDKTDQYLLNNYVIRIRKEVAVSFLYGNCFTNIIDVGCGNADISKQFLNDHNMLTLVDISEQMLSIAKNNIPEKFHKALNFICGNIDDLDLPGSSFDLLICTGLLAHVNDPAETVIRLARLIKPGGVMILQNTSSGHPFSWMIDSLEIIKWVFGYSRFLYKRISNNKLRKILTSGNLSVNSSFRSIVSFFIFGRYLQPKSKYKLVRWLFGSPEERRFQFLGNDYIYYLIKDKI